MISEITELTKLETNTVTPLLQRMEKQGLIIRSKGLVDTRQRIISLTKEGKKLEEVIKEVPNCLSREIVGSGISIEELTAIVPLLDKFISVMENKNK